MPSEVKSLNTIGWQSQASEQRLRLTFVHSLGSALDPSPVPSLSQPQKLVAGDRLVRCSSNACWWKPDELAFVGPEGCLQIVHVPSAHRLMYVDNHYFLPGMLRSLAKAWLGVTFQHAKGQVGCHDAIQVRLLLFSVLRMLLLCVLKLLALSICYIGIRWVSSARARTACYQQALHPASNSKVSMCYAGLSTCYA